MGVPVKGIELAQAAEEFGSDGNFACLVVLGLGDVNDESFAVDVTGLDGKCLADAQAALIEDGEEGPVAAVAEGSQQQGNLVTSQDVGKRFLAFDVDLFPNIPVEPEVVAVKGAQSADGLIDGGRCELAVVLEVDEKIEHAGRWQIGKLVIRVVGVELMDPAVVALPAPLGETFELDEAGEVLIPRSRRECVIFFS